MSEASDIVEWLRDAATSYTIGTLKVPEISVRLVEAADLIERQRQAMANWEAAWAMQRGSVAAAPGDSEPFVILPAEPNAPR